LKSSIFTYALFPAPYALCLIYHPYPTSQFSIKNPTRNCCAQ
jgi:hypothetical protein